MVSVFMVSAVYCLFDIQPGAPRWERWRSAVICGPVQSDWSLRCLCAAEIDTGPVLQEPDSTARRNMKESLESGTERM